MRRVCNKCNKEYDDAEAYTLCPHVLIMAPADLERKKAAIALLATGSYVRFHHQTDQDRLTLMGCTREGFILLQELPGGFSPSLFAPIPETESVK